MSRKQKQKQNQTKQVNKKKVRPLSDYESAYRDARKHTDRLDKKIIKTVTKGTQYDWLNNTSFNNLIYPKDKIPDRLLRLCERRNGIVASIITLRVQQALEFSKISFDKDIPGWEFALIDPKATPNSNQLKQKNFLENLLKKTKIDNYDGYIKKHDTFKDMFVKYVRDKILIDKVCWEIERNGKDETVAIWPLDGATIVPVLPGGFYGSTSQIGLGIGNGFNRLTDEIRKARLEDVPEPENISYVQELIFGGSGGGLTAAFTDDDLIYDISGDLNDVRYYRQGFSVTERANVAIVAFINSLTFNSNGLSRGAIPKIAIAMGQDSGYTQEQLEDAQDEWAANFSAMDGQWNIPLLDGDAKVLNLLPTNRDMEYQRYMEFAGALTCATMGADSAEIGLKLNQAQGVFGENQDAKQIFSKNRGVREMLNGFTYLVNRWKDICGYDFAEDWHFKFNGITVEDKSFEADLRKKDVESIKFIDEVRAEIDLPPLPDGSGKIILNPIWMQNKQMAEQSQMGEEGESENDEDFNDENINSMVDESMQDLEKAVTLM